MHTLLLLCPVEGAIYYIPHRIQPSRSGSNMIFSAFYFCSPFFFWLLFARGLRCVCVTRIWSRDRDDSCRCTSTPFPMHCYSIDCVSHQFFVFFFFFASLSSDTVPCMRFPAQSGCVTFDPVFAIVQLECATDTFSM